MFLQTKAKPDFLLASVKDLTLSTGRKKREASEELGIELEIEGTNLGTAFLKLQDTGCDYWQEGIDGSLVNGYEYTFVQPFNREIAKKAIEAFFNCFNTHAQIENSSRCSTHVHLNFQHMSMLQVYTFKTLFYLLEWPLFQKFAPERIKNTFCIPSFRQGNFSKHLTSSLKKGRFSPTDKYRALNDSPLSSYGSIEIRLLGGSDNAEKPLTWLGVLLELYDYIKDNPRITPSDILDQEDLLGFVKTTFPKLWEHLKDFKNIGDMLDFGVQSVQSYAYALDWAEVKTAKAPENPRRVDPNLSGGVDIIDDFEPEDDDDYDYDLD